MNTSAAPLVNKKRILVVGQTKGFEHDSVPDAMGSVWKMGHETGLWDTYLRTDTELLTKGKVGPNGKNLDDFNLIVFASTTGELELTADQKKDILSFVHDDGKGFVGAHTGDDAFFEWPEFVDIIGGWFDKHPWGVFDAPVIVEDTAFPAMKPFPARFTIKDEIYQHKDFTRAKVRVLASLDSSKLDYTKPNIHREDKDFPVAWAKMYGKGRVFYSTFGHAPETWDDPQIQKMYFEATRWALRLIGDDVTPGNAAPLRSH